MLWVWLCGVLVRREYDGVPPFNGFSFVLALSGIDVGIGIGNGLVEEEFEVTLVAV